MRSLCIICILCASALSAVSAGVDHVLELTDENFSSEIGNHAVILVEFYAPWCGHCKSLAPEYSAAASVLAKDDPPISIAKVDCIGNGKATCEKFSVSGFPTLKIFRGGEFANEYDGGRTKDAIVKYMRSKAGPVSKVLETVADVETFASNKENPVVIGFFKTEDSDSFREFYGLAPRANEDFKFGHTFNVDALKKFGYSDKTVVFRPTLLKSKFEEQRSVHESGDIHDWLKKSVCGLVGVRTGSNGQYFAQPLVTAYYKVDYELDPKGTQYWRNRVMKVAQDFKEKFTFSVASASDFASEVEEFGFQDKEGAVRVAIKDDKGQKFPMNDDFTMDAFRMFLQSFVDGQLTPYLKSESVPEDNSGPVKVVVAKNFDEIVNDESKDVLVEFYAPWCGHCKQLEPKLNDLAEKLKDEPNVVIAKMDATANDVPAPYTVKGFPTIYFAPRKAKDSPKTYQGGREVKDFIEYLARESKLTGYDKKGKKKDEL